MVHEMLSIGAPARSSTVMARFRRSLEAGHTIRYGIASYDRGERLCLSAIGGADIWRLVAAWARTRVPGASAGKGTRQVVRRLRRSNGTAHSQRFCCRYVRAPVCRAPRGLQQEEAIVERQVINPWSWQDQFGFVQANSLSGGQRLLICAGQAAVDAQGHPLHPGDMPAQLTQALDNLETVLQAGGCRLADVVRLNIYTTDIDALFATYGVLVQRLTEAGCTPASTLLGVARLAFPENLIELEATAMI